MADLKMLRREMAIGYLAAGFLAVLVPDRVWATLFVPGHGIWTSIENALVGPVIAFLSFVCSVGNVPLAAALWKGGISFGGVISFIFADLVAAAARAHISPVLRRCTYAAPGRAVLGRSCPPPASSSGPCSPLSG